MFKFSLESNSTVVDYVIQEVGDDLHISITGGDIHIGGIGLVSNGTYNIADYASIIVNVPKSDSGNSSMYTVNSSQSLTSILNPNTLT